jgi:hypothetical protein
VVNHDAVFLAAAREDAFEVLPRHRIAVVLALK